MIKLRRNVLHYFLFENQSIYMRCHKSFGINLGGAHCSLRRLHLFSFFGVKFEPSGWLSTEVIAFFKKNLTVLSI